MERIYRIQPTGPYALLGWSHGGLVAVAMAEQLARDGWTVDFVGLIDVVAALSVASATPGAQDDEAEIADLLRQIDDPGRRMADLAITDAEIARRAATVIRHQDALVRGYQIPCLSVPLTVWWANQSLPRRVEERDWSQHTAAGVRYQEEIDTDHTGIIRHPVFLASLRREFGMTD